MSIDKMVDFILCCGFVTLEVLGVIIVGLLIQLVFYQLFGINLYRKFNNLLDGERSSD